MVTGEKKEFDILDYLQKGKTMYDKLDEYLGGYLNGDYSNINLLDKFRDYSTKFEQSERDRKFFQRLYNELFDELISNLYLAIGDGQATDKIKVFTDEEKSIFLKELQSIDKENVLKSEGAQAAVKEDILQTERAQAAVKEDVLQTEGTQAAVKEDVLQTEGAQVAVKENVLKSEGAQAAVKEDILQTEGAQAAVKEDILQTEGAQDVDKESILQSKETKVVNEDDRVPSIEAYLKLIKSKNFSEEYYNNLEIYSKLNRAIIDKGLQVLDDDGNKYIRTNILGWYTARLGNLLKRKYPNRAIEYYPEWEEFNFIKSTFENLKRLEKYEELLSSYQNNVDDYAKKLAIQIKCKEKRRRFVLGALYEGMKPIEQEEAMRTSAIDVAYPKLLDLEIRKSERNWRIKLYSTPKFICDSIAKYSNNEEESQRVVAVSYGIFESDSMLNGNSDPLVRDNMQFIGVSRFGQDGLKNYFVLVSLPNNELTKALALEKGQLKKNISMDEIRDIFQSVNGSNKNYVYRIPKELEDYYATVAFSDECLNKAVTENSRFAGSVDMSAGKPRISAGYTEQARNIEAACHACMYPGNIGERTYASLGDFCKSTELLAKHIEAVNEITKNRIEQDKGETR